VAFAIDTGYIALTKTRMQRASDAAALAGALKALVPPGEPQDPAAVRAEVRKYVELNTSGLTVRDQDIKLVRYTPSNPPNTRLSYTYSSTQPANGVQVTLRRDTTANNPLKLFFAPVIGTKTVPLAVTSTAYLQSAMGVYAGAPLLPYTMQIDYFNEATGQTTSGSGGGLIGLLSDLLSDLYTVNPTTLQVALGPDGVNEVKLFGDHTGGSGNFGSLDIGSVSNSTGELNRQILSGPTDGDFAHSDFAGKVAPDGALYVPFNATGDTGLTTSVKTSFEAILGQPRIIPLYDTVTGTGDSAAYHIVGYAGVVVTKVDFTGSPKKVWVQPAFVVSNRVTAGTPTSGAVQGVSLPPKLVIP
jgi:Flp pilus assembly protein TadG